MFPVSICFCLSVSIFVYLQAAADKIIPNYNRSRYMNGNCVYSCSASLNFYSVASETNVFEDRKLLAIKEVVW